MTLEWGSTAMNNGTYNTGSFTLYALNCSCSSPSYLNQSTTDLKSIKGNNLILSGSSYNQYFAPRRTIGVGKPGGNGVVVIGCQ